MQIIAIRNGTNVDRYSTTEPFLPEMLKSVNVGKLLIMFAPFVTGPSFCHWKMARRISAKPSVAMAR